MFFIAYFISISILSLYTEGDRESAKWDHLKDLFQSSPSIQRETHPEHPPRRDPDISILSLYTEGDDLARDGVRVLGISILSLYTEGDGAWETPTSSSAYFNPLPLYRGRPVDEDVTRSLTEISILSLYTEGDSISTCASCSTPISILSLYTEGDDPAADRRLRLLISILSLYTEGDSRSGCCTVTDGHFNPLPLYRGRRRFRPEPGGHAHFNPLPLYRGRPTAIHSFSPSWDFNPLPLYRGRPLGGDLLPRSGDFNPLPLYRGRRQL